MPTPPAAPKYLGCMLQRLAGKSKVVHGQSVIRSEFFVSLFLAASCSILLRQQPKVVSLAPCIVYHKASPPRTPKSIPRVRPCLVSLHPFVRGTRHRAPPRPRPRGESRARLKFCPGSVYRLSRSLAKLDLRIHPEDPPNCSVSPHTSHSSAQFDPESLISSTRSKIRPWYIYQLRANARLHVLGLVVSHETA